jgi:hypothetical protein
MERTKVFNPFPALGVPIKNENTPHTSTKSTTETKLTLNKITPNYIL